MRCKNMAEKITKELTWQALEAEYRIRIKNGVKENELAEAIEAGALLNLLQDCADKLHSGDFSRVIEAFRRNLSSTKCNKVKSNTFRTVDRERYELLDTYTKQFVNTAKANVVTSDKPKWQATKAEIDTIKDNYEELRKLYNLMYDYVRRYRDRIEMVTTYEEYEALSLYVKELRDAADPKNATVSESVLEKLRAGKKLTKAENEELLKLLAK